MSTLKADTIQNTSGGAATLTKQSAAKHFITYDNSQTITDSFNNSSITDVGTGNHKYAFTNNFATAKGYTCGGVMAWNSDQLGTYVYQVQPLNSNDVLTGSVEMTTVYVNSSGNSNNDYYYNCSESNGDLA